MLKRQSEMADEKFDPVPALLHHLNNDNDVLRTGAVRAISASAPGDERVRIALLDALLDQDPDVRSDAMEELASFARLEDAEILRKSLLGDPVREVKLAAISLLCNLGDVASIPVFRTLVASRDEDNVNWEFETGTWDEWLDIQVACIEALGQLKAEDAIEDILAARDDELGQNLDMPVFRALANMGNEGAVWLLSVAKTESGLARKRALEVLATTGDDALRDHVDFLFDDKMPEVRRLVLPLLDPTGERAAHLALGDSDAGVRRDALIRFAPDCPELAVTAVTDVNENVQAVALDYLQQPLDEKFGETLLANMNLWMDKAGPHLASASARNWLRLSPENPSDLLVELARDISRPLTARITAVDALATVIDQTSTERMISFLSDESQQVRMVALTHLANFAARGDETAEQTLALAIEGVLLAPDKAVVSRDTTDDDDAPDMATPKGDELPGPRLRISPDGDILPVVIGADTPKTLSTLETMQLSRIETKADVQEEEEEAAAEDTPEESGAKRRKRRAVEGPDNVGSDLSRVALGICAEVPGAKIYSAILAKTEATDDVLRLEGYRALLKRAAPPTDQARVRVRAGLSDHLGPVRSVAAEIATRDPELANMLAAYLDDPDALVRACAVEAITDAREALAHLTDKAQVVRGTALGCVLKSSDPSIQSAAFDIALNADWVETLAEIINGSDVVTDLAVEKISDESLGSKQVHMLLQAFAKTRRGTPANVG